MLTMPCGTCLLKMTNVSVFSFVLVISIGFILSWSFVKSLCFSSGRYFWYSGCIFGMNTCWGERDSFLRSGKAPDCVWKSPISLLGAWTGVCWSGISWRGAIFCDISIKGVDGLAWTLPAIFEYSSPNTCAVCVRYGASFILDGMLYGVWHICALISSFLLRFKEA